MSLSKTAHELNSKTLKNILKHPFNQELKKGTLSKDKFSYYIEQDGVYLQGAARCLALIAAKVPVECVSQFLCYSNDMFVAEQEVVHHFFKKLFQFKETGLIAPATLAYTSYQLSCCALDPVEVAIASVLPGFWVYSEVGLSLSKSSVKNNPYQRWIDTYAGDDFKSVVQEVTRIFDLMAEKTTHEIRQKMIEVFSRATSLEWYFCDDSYKKITL